ncbi:hypothetical protein BJ912DRAFT_932850 [Pholiota molesta]|nr:hypothetical protein BJ912DRAFT_932850 [Pholiota molesta]
MSSTVSVYLPTSCIVFRDPQSNKERRRNCTKGRYKPLGTQNDGEIVEEVDQEDEERRIYPSTLEDESDGKSDAEGIDTTKGLRKIIWKAPDSDSGASKTGIRTSTTTTNAVDATQISATSSPPPPQNFVILLALATHRSKTTTIALVRRCTPLGNVLNPPAQRLKRLAHVIIQYKTNVLSRYSDTIYGLPASSYVAFRGPQRYASDEPRRNDLILALFSRCVISHMSMDYAGQN